MNFLTKLFCGLGWHKWRIFEKYYKMPFVQPRIQCRYCSKVYKKLNKHYENNNQKQQYTFGKFTRNQILPEPSLLIA